MSNSLVQPVVLACALALTLPSGWCCLLPLRPVQAAAVQKSAARCCHNTIEPAQTACCSGKRSHSGSPAPSAPLVKACCCSILLSLPPASIAPSQPVAIALLVTPDMDGFTAAGMADPQLDDFSPPSCPLHVFQCVWRC